MTTNTYTEPVSKLLKLGRPDEPWHDYSALGIGRSDIPQLIRLVQDHELRLMERPSDLPDEEDLPEWYAQIHAWRALGQLKAEEAIPALVGILHQIDEEDDDWIGEDAPDVFTLIGPVAIQPLGEYLTDGKHALYARTAAATSLARIAQDYPEMRDVCVRILASVLEKYTENDEGLNGFIVYELVRLKAVEHVELMGRAFAASAVDEFIMGDIEDVQIGLGLLEKRLTPERRLSWRRESPSETETFRPAQKTARAEKKHKKKRKQEKKSRQRNRRK